MGLRPPDQRDWVIQAIFKAFVVRLILMNEQSYYELQAEQEMEMGYKNGQMMIYGFLKAERCADQTKCQMFLPMGVSCMPTCVTWDTKILNI